MLSLAELQSTFSDISLGADAGALSGVIIGDGFTPEQRLQIHRNNTTILLAEALAATFHIVHELVGEDFFTQVARSFVRTHPPTSPCLFEYGQGFPAFLQSLPQLSDMAYVADVAELEWQANAAFHASEAKPLVAEDLAAIPPEELALHHLRPHPSVRFVSSAFPIKQIWDMHQDGADPDLGVNLDDGGDAILIVRPHAEVNIHALSPNAYILASRLADGVIVGQAFAILEGVESVETLPLIFAELIATGMFEKIQ
ncbi:DNA-binding domain-containing protein [Magnetovibrio sp. PR-2]|uniref:DNA-binding domain-containing protein n=1 Tax=Magnetovibrio sp. PR-2 TaxID=3120356 RepID=UPI002FCE3749